MNNSEMTQALRSEGGRAELKAELLERMENGFALSVTQLQMLLTIEAMDREEDD